MAPLHKSAREQSSLLTKQNILINEDVLFTLLCPHQESNLDCLLRTELFYPLNYKGK